jgi:hypothetical protein
MSEKEKEELEEEVLALREKQYEFQEEIGVAQAEKVRKITELISEVSYLTGTACVAQTSPQDANEKRSQL